MFVFAGLNSLSSCVFIMVRRGNPIPPKFQGMNDYERDLEIINLRRTIELLQRQLEWQQNDAQPRRIQREAHRE